MTSNGKQLTEMLTATARDQSVQLKSLESQRVFKTCFCFLLPHNELLDDWSLGEQSFLFPSNPNVVLGETKFIVI